MATTKSAVKTAKTSRGLTQDRSKVAGKQDYELAYEKKKTGAPAAAVKKAIASEGNSRAAVEKKLKRK
jgi:hypothetical protein